MYVRFIAPGAALRPGIDHGLFRPAYALCEDRGTAETLVLAIRDGLDWFETELPVPRRRCFLVKSRKRWLAEGICWFRDDAREMIARAFALAALIEACGVPVVKRATRRPGQILYRDAWQIVAKPEAATPTAWR
jgi:hypothetical protein